MSDNQKITEPSPSSVEKHWLITLVRDARSTTRKLERKGSPKDEFVLIPGAAAVRLTVACTDDRTD